MKFSLQTLGTGTGGQTPVAGCQCPNCKKAWNNKDFQRKNCTNLIKYENITFFIDYGTHRTINTPVDFILLSHLHLDHMLGLFRLKWSQQKKTIPVYIPPNTDLEYIKDFFDYFLLNFQHLKLRKKYPTIFEFKHYHNLETMKIHTPKSPKIEITPVPLNHDVPASGFFITLKNAKFATLMDSKLLPKTTMDFLLDSKPDVVLIDSTYPSNMTEDTHNNMKEALDILFDLNVPPTIGILTHISHTVMPDRELEEYGKQNPDKKLDNVFIASDNRVFDLTKLL